MATSTEAEIEALLDGLEPLCKEAMRILAQTEHPYYPKIKAITFRGSRIRSGMDRPMKIRAQREKARVSPVTAWRLGVQPFILSNHAELMFKWTGVTHPRFPKAKPEFASLVSTENAVLFLEPMEVRRVIEELASIVHP